MIVNIIRSASGKIESFFKTKAVLKLLALIVIFIVFVKFIGWLPSLQVKRCAVPERIRPVNLPALGDIPKEAGFTEVAANGGKTLYADPASGNITVIDDESGIVWNAFRCEEDEEPENKSLLRVSFLAEDNAVSSWYSYNYSQKDGKFSLEKIQNGVRVNIRIENADPTDINAFMPRRIAIDRYERVFFGGLDEKAENGSLSATEAARYKSILGMLYSKDEERGFYYNKLSASPPGSTVRQMLTMVRILGYTVDNLIEDESPYDLPAEDRRPLVGFTIPIDFVLDNGDLVVSVTTENITVHNDFYTLAKLYLLPNLGSVSPAESPNGYIFVPDGSGALFALNSFDPGYSGYERPLYWNTVFRDFDSMPLFPEDLQMPVYGMICGKTSGFMAIIEKGDETAFIGAKMASPASGSSGDKYNSVYSGFDLAQYKQVSISGVSSHGGTYTVSTGMLEMDCVVRYKFFGKAVSYFDMASLYKNYLIDKYNLHSGCYSAPQIFLDVTGALTIDGRILGMKYERNVTMTSYASLEKIIQELKDIPLTVSYSGVFNSGIDNKLSNRAVPVRKNGKPSGLDSLMQTASDTDTDLFMGTNISRVYKQSGNGFNERIHAAYGYENKPALFMEYNPPTKMNKPLSTRYTLMNPVYLPNVADNFLGSTEHIRKLYIRDLGADYHANYRKNNIVPPLAARVIVDDVLNRFYAEKAIILNNPNMDKIRYADWAVNISRESSNFGGFYTSIPFRQLVMNGLILYTTLETNNTAETPDYSLLQALELGSVPKFFITAKNADALKYTVHTKFLSTEYTIHRNTINRIYREWNDAYAKTGTTEIINHETLRDRVYRTNYRGGTSVTVNYNHFAAETDEGELIPPLGYIIGESKEY